VTLEAMAVVWATVTYGQMVKAQKSPRRDAGVAQKGHAAVPGRARRLNLGLSSAWIFATSAGIRLILAQLV
jgi:hypothetical protein